MRKHLLASLSVELRMNSFRNASVTSEIATDADYTRKLIKTVFCCESYMNCEIKQNLRVNYTKLKLSSHKFLVERARWRKVKIPYAQRTCTLCSSGDIENEYHIVLICENFRDVRYINVKYNVSTSSHTITIDPACLNSLNL